MTESKEKKYNDVEYVSIKTDGILAVFRLREETDCHGVPSMTVLLDTLLRRP